MKRTLLFAMGLSSMVALAQEGKVGINTDGPTTTLHIKTKTTTDEPLRLENLKQVDASQVNQVLLTNADGVVKKSPNYNRTLGFVLPADLVILNKIGSGASENITTMTKATDDIAGVTVSGNKLTFSEGVYILNFTYAGMKNAGIKTATRPNTISDTQCTISSYYIDFPASGADNGTARIHSNQIHNAGATSSDENTGQPSTVHGGTINYILEVPSGKSKSFTIHLGRGVGGNCEYNTWWQTGGDNSIQRYGGITLAKGTSFTVTRLQ